MSAIDDLVHVVREPAGEPAGALVLMHGRGTNEQDLAPLLDVFDPDRRLLGITPRAPFELPAGGHHWYVTRRVGFPDHDTFMSTVERLGPWVDAIPDAYGVPLERTVLGGFSQGGVLAYSMSLARGRPSPAGILALSTFIPVVEGFTLDLGSRGGLPVQIVHGQLDEIIDVIFGREAYERLTTAGLDVGYREPVIGHAVDPMSVEPIRDWLAHTLDQPQPAAG